MAEFTGTKGEWRISKDGTEVTTSKIGILEGSKRICHITEFGKTDDEKLANAKLIAASPELLQTVIELHDLLEEHLPNWYLKHHHNIIQKAIKKATE
jgi:hypothetical protein